MEANKAPWLRFYGDVPAHLDCPDKTMYQLVEAVARKYPDSPAYSFMGRKTSFAQFLERGHSGAHILLDGFHVNGMHGHLCDSRHQRKCGKKSSD